MDNISEVMNTRRSIRKFTDEPVPEEDINKIVSSALLSPSACNCQSFYFVAVRNKELIEKTADAVEKGIDDFYSEAEAEYTALRKKQSTFFKKAPLVIFVYLTDMEYYQKQAVDVYASKGYDSREMLRMIGEPDVLSVGAAVENMLLTIHSLGYGACWMSDPIVSEGNINEVLGMNPSYRLMGVIPVGKSAYTPRPKKSKELSDILEIR